MDTNSFKEREERRQTSFKVIYDITMGVIWLSAGIFIILNKYFGYNFQLDNLMSSMFGIACLAYGSFRLWRGISTRKYTR